MGKNTYCIDCVESYRRTISPAWGSNSNLIEEGCKECHRVHLSEVYMLEEQVNSLQLDIAENKKIYETDLLEQKTELEQRFSQSSLEVSELKDHIAILQKKLQFLQVPRDSSSGDIVIAVPGLEVAAHRALLASKSPVFQEMIQSEAVAKLNEGIKIGGVSPSVLEATVEFCYTGDLVFSELVPANEVLKFAHTFELGLLKEYCEAELCRDLTVDNVPEMLKLSRMFEATRLEEEAGMIFKENFDLLKTKIYEVLEGSGSDISESCPGASPDFDEEY